VSVSGFSGEDAVAALRDALGGATPPPGVASQCSAAQLELLAAEVQRARASQSRALREATEQGLRRVPRPLRSTVRKVVLR
jgi:hypothetical protein